MNWASAMAWIMKPTGRPPQDLWNFVQRRVKVKPAKPKVRLPRGMKRDSLPKMKKELDRVFSIFIRTRKVDFSGSGLCVTCDHYAHWKEMDCGHYVPRQDMATRWDEKNCHLQCKSCNGFRGGEPEKMAAYIDEKYGAGTARALREQSKSFRPTRIWLESRINYYKLEIGE